MEYKRKLFTMPAELAERISKEKNQSATVVDALQRYFAGQDGAKALAKLTLENTQAVNGLDEDVDKVYKLLRKIAVAMRNSGADIEV